MPNATNTKHRGLEERAKQLATDALRHRAEKTRRRGYLSERTLDDMSATGLLRRPDFTMTGASDRHAEKYAWICDAMKAVYHLRQICKQSADAVRAAHFSAPTVLDAIQNPKIRTHWLNAIASGNVPTLHEVSDVELNASENGFVLDSAQFEMERTVPSKLHVLIVTSGPHAGTAIILNHTKRCWKPAVTNRQINTNEIFYLRAPGELASQSALIDQGLRILSASDAIANLPMKTDHERTQANRIAGQLRDIYHQICNQLAEIDAEDPIAGVNSHDSLLTAAHEVETKAYHVAQNASPHPPAHKAPHSQTYIAHLRQSMIRELRACAAEKRQKTFIAAAE